MQRDHDETLTQLGNAIAPRLHNPLLDAVAELLEFFDHAAQDEHFPVQRHIGNVLHDHGGWAHQRNHLEKRPPKVSALVVRITKPSLNTVPDLRAAGSRERLAWRTPGNQVHPCATAQVRHPGDIGGVRQVPVHRHPGEVMGMGPIGEGVGVGAEHNAEAGVLQTSAEPSRTAEEICGKPSTALLEVLSQRQEAFLIVGMSGVWRELHEWSPNQPNTEALWLRRRGGRDGHSVTIVRRARTDR